MMMPDIQAVKEYFTMLQNQICEALAKEDSNKQFVDSHWEYHTGGGGNSRILENGKVIERGGVNFSYIQGLQLPESATNYRCEVSGKHYEATGISMVIHPLNPYAPTMHANLRFFSINHEHSDKDRQDEQPKWWFGGGFDLTPYYGFEEDCIHWHKTAKAICEPFGEEVYPMFKQWCDEYFYIKHRNEPRGIGGLFFDDFSGWSFERCFEFVRSVGDHILPAYLPILSRRKEMPYDQQQREFQLYRRGRYVEFNLVYDRGTLFGLQSGGRIESILMSLPPLAEWRYDWKPQPGSAEAALYEKFLVPQDWV